MAAQAMRPLKDTHDPLIGYSVDVNNSLNFLQKDLADAASLGTEEQNLFLAHKYQLFKITYLKLV
jgi:hypothetical protein